MTTIIISLSIDHGWWVESISMISCGLVYVYGV